MFPHRGLIDTGSCFWSTDGDPVLWTALTEVARGLCTLLSSLLSAQVGVVSVAGLAVVVGSEPSQCGQPPKVAFSLPQVSVSDHVSLNDS